MLNNNTNGAKPNLLPQLKLANLGKPPQQDQKLIQNFVYDANSDNYQQNPQHSSLSSGLQDPPSNDDLEDGLEEEERPHDHKPSNKM